MALQPFLANRAAVASNHDGKSPSASSGGFQRLFDETARDESAVPACPDGNAPKIDVVEENGRVGSIVVTCRCGERIELNCRY